MHSPELYISLVESAPAISWVLDLATFRFTYVSPNAADILGYPAHEWTGFDFWAKQLHPDDRDHAVSFCQTETIANRDHAFEYRFRHAKGHYVWLRDVVLVVRHNGQPAALRGYLLDITPIKQAEEALRRSEERFRNLVENTVDWIWETGQDGCFTYVNPQAERLTGFTPEELIGREPFCFMPPDEAARAQARLSPPDGVHRPITNLESVMRHKDGSTLTFETNAVPVRDPNGTFLGYRGICRETSERKQHEAERLKARNIESLGVLAGGIAHDFNNLLTAVFGNLYLAMRHLPEDSEARRLLSQASLAMDKARNLTSQLLTFSRGGDPARKEADLPRLLEDTSRFIFSGSNIRPVLRLPLGLPLVEINKNQLEQVFHHIFLNAKEAMPNGGIVEIQAETLPPDQAAGPGAVPLVRIQVADQGTGVRPEILPKIFLITVDLQPFFDPGHSLSGVP